MSYWLCCKIPPRPRCSINKIKLFVTFYLIQYRSCWQWWSILPHTYKFFIILIVLAVVLVGFLFIEDLLKNSPANNTSSSKAHTEGTNKRRYVPNPGWDYNHPKSYSKLHLFKNGAVCSDTKVCSEIGK